MIEDNRIVKSIEELICDEHFYGFFYVLSKIPNSSNNIYCCDSCLENRKTLAYECPICGIVKDSVKRDGMRKEKFYCQQYCTYCKANACCWRK